MLVGFACEALCQCTIDHAHSHTHAHQDAAKYGQGKPVLELSVMVLTLLLPGGSTPARLPWLEEMPLIYL